MGYKISQLTQAVSTQSGLGLREIELGGSEMGSYRLGLDALRQAMFLGDASLGFSTADVHARAYYGDGSHLTGLAGGGSVTNVSGTTNRISVVNNTSTPVVDIDAAYAGQASITTVGTLSSGAVPASLVSAGTFAGSFVFSSLISGAIDGNAATATKLASARTLAITGDLAWTSPGFDGSGNVTAVGTLPSVISAAGPIGAAGTVPIITFDAKGRLTTVTSATIVAATATALAAGRTLAITGDLAWTSPSFDGSSNVTATGTLATVNMNTGGFGSATQVATFTVNGKGLITAAGNATITPAASSITGGAALTKTDDTNVTLTLGGAPASALLVAASLSLGWTGVLSSTRGGTGVNNGSATLTLGGSVTHSGSFTTTLIVTANTSVTLPTSGTLVNSAVTTLSSLVSIGTITTGVWTGTTIAVANGGSGTTTLTGILKGNGTSAFTAVTAPSGALVGDTDSQTLTNKTLTGPVMTAPVLGTPASGIGTNITGITAAHVVAGTFGTGAYTMDTSLTVPQQFNTSNAVAASSNAATITRANRVNTVTNNSAAGLTITLSTSGALDGDLLLIRSLPSSAVAQTITWVNTEVSDVTPSANLNASTTLPRSDGFEYNGGTSKWRCIASA